MRDGMSLQIGRELPCEAAHKGLLLNCEQSLWPFRNQALGEKKRTGR